MNSTTELVATVISDFPWIVYMIIAAVTYYILLMMLNAGTNLAISMELNLKRKKKQDERISEIELLQNSVKQVPYETVNEILNLTAEQVVQSVKSSEYLCSEVLEAFQSKACEAHLKTNCLVLPVKEATQWAIDQDKYTEKKGALFGLPVSMKDNYGIEGYDGTVGLAQQIDKPFAEDCVIVKVLKEQGAIPFVKTNVPQTMLSWETSNPIYGTTNHFKDHSRGVGGSSGGEGALIGYGASKLGMGSDIGGSIRIPAALCGIAGLKPTAGRLSSKGTAPLQRGQTCCRSSMGPMANDVDTLVLAMKALCVPEMWDLDPYTPPIPFNEEAFSQWRPLKIGYYLHDGFIEPHPAMVRGVKKARKALQRIGHYVEEWEIPSELFRELITTWGVVILGDQGEELLRRTKNDSIDNCVKTTLLGLKLPIFVKKFLRILLKPFVPLVSQVISASIGCESVSEWWKTCERVQELKNQFISEMRKNEFDAILAPGFACPAPLLGTGGRVPIASSYTALYNILDMPAGTVPVTTVSSYDDAQLANYQVKDIAHWMLKRGMDSSAGLPVNVQLITLPWKEELCLRLMKDLEEQIMLKAQSKGSKFVPGYDD